MLASCDIEFALWDTLAAVAHSPRGDEKVFEQRAEIEHGCRTALWLMAQSSLPIFEFDALPTENQVNAALGRFKDGTFLAPLRMQAVSVPVHLFDERTRTTDVLNWLMIVISDDVSSGSGRSMRCGRILSFVGPRTSSAALVLISECSFSMVEEGRGELRALSPACFRPGWRGGFDAEDHQTLAEDAFCNAVALLDLANRSNAVSRLSLRPTEREIGEALERQCTPEQPRALMQLQQTALPPSTCGTC